MTQADDDPDARQSDEVSDDGVLDADETLLSDQPSGDPLDTGIEPPDHWSEVNRFGMTPAEERRGESLDQLLSEEEPDIQPDAVDDRWPDGPEPRAGRLRDNGEEMVGVDVGVDCGAASAEEAAVHWVDEDTDRAAVPDDADEYESLPDAVRNTDLDQQRDRDPDPDDPYRP
ncbi:DUF5709 domain-containing protein [Actinocatenispora sera]|uniref:DUF5709 domain-containing protein n=1 Tax=Actinocatenispora sera TaxID=390989 RepID=A0A810L5V3_9ACTN|nr:DUF5709 domain-containing protein [Actinocatenispora sera]BCJ29488.1 hypothetical protein Asera_35960 [Actinocatenispora sera]